MTDPNSVDLLSVASLISKMVVYINNVEVCKINIVNNCFILEQLQMMKDSEIKMNIMEYSRGNRDGSRHLGQSTPQSQHRRALP